MNTLVWIQWLFERGWELKCSEEGLPDSCGCLDPLWTWRRPEGIGGYDYESTVFGKLPPAVEEYVLANALMAAKHAR